MTSFKSKIEALQASYALAEGAKAFVSGSHINPYTKGSKAYEEWQDGWEEARFLRYIGEKK